MINTLAHDADQIIIQANNTYSFIQSIYKLLSTTSRKNRLIIITDIHILTKAHQIQIYKLLINYIHEQFLLISHCMPIAAIATLCKVYHSNTIHQEHNITQYLRKNTLANRDSMHDAIMQMDDKEAQIAMQAIGHFFEKCLLMRPQAYIALDKILLYWHQIYSDHMSGLITGIQCIKLLWIFLGKHFFVHK